MFEPQWFLYLGIVEAMFIIERNPFELDLAQRIATFRAILWAVFEHGQGSLFIRWNVQQFVMKLLVLQSTHQLDLRAQREFDLLTGELEWNELSIETISQNIFPPDSAKLMNELDGLFFWASENGSWEDALILLRVLHEWLSWRWKFPHSVCRWLATLWIKMDWFIPENSLNNGPLHTWLIVKLDQICSKAIQMSWCNDVEVWEARWLIEKIVPLMSWAGFLAFFSTSRQLAYTPPILSD